MQRHFIVSKNILANNAERIPKVMSMIIKEM